MKTLIACSFVALAAMSCNKPDADTRAAEQSTSNTAADNTKKNARDRDMETLTPGDQADNDVDRTITQKVRQAVVNDKDMSMNAKNIKIITSEGSVTLRGPVKTESEKTEIGTLVQRIDGVRKVDNQLEIAK